MITFLCEQKMKQAKPFVEKALYHVLDFVTLYLFLFSA